MSDCKHPKTANMQGQIISPARHYGDGLEGMLVCHVCGQVIEEKGKGR